MKTKIFYFLFLVSILSACKVSKQNNIPSNFPVFYKEGHRGTRGLMPENTIPAMLKAVDLGCNVIEVDVYLTKDAQVLIAHDPYINPSISLLPGNREVSKDSAKNYIWRQMNYEDIRKIDVGMKVFPQYPKQQKIPAYMPLLGELIDSVENYIRSKNLPKVIYNIEIKSNPKFDGVYQPLPPVLIKAVMDVLKTKNIGNRFYIQSFDMRQVQEVHKSYPGVTIGFLTDAKNLSVSENLAQLGFVPDIYSPFYKLVTKEMSDTCRARKMKLVPWTVNTAEEMKSLIDLGVNGIITDYPDLFPQVGK
jgi:glycerophosphoryl diester phosphodiesterase